MKVIKYRMERIDTGWYALRSNVLGQTGHSIIREGKEWVATNMDGEIITTRPTKRECFDSLMGYVEQSEDEDYDLVWAEII